MALILAPRFRRPKAAPGRYSRPIAPLTPDQLRTRERVESVIRLAAPALDLLLAVGDRLSRLVEPEDHEYYPPRTNTGTEPPPPGPRQADAGARRT
jgi:hypothetical protein